MQLSASNTVRVSLCVLWWTLPCNISYCERLTISISFDTSCDSVLLRAVTLSVPRLWIQAQLLLLLNSPASRLLREALPPCQKKGRRREPQGQWLPVRFERGAKRILCGIKNGSRTKPKWKVKKVPTELGKYKKFKQKQQWHQKKQKQGQKPSHKPKPVVILSERTCCSAWFTHNRVDRFYHFKGKPKLIFWLSTHSRKRDGRQAPALKSKPLESNADCSILPRDWWTVQWHQELGRQLDYIWN